MLMGCASFQGAPDPVISNATAAGILRRYPVATTIANFRSDDETRRGNMEPRAYRDMVVGLYVAASDAGYYEFRRSLSSEMRGSRFGSSLILL